MFSEETLETIDAFYAMHPDFVQAWNVDGTLRDGQPTITVFTHGFSSSLLSEEEQKHLKLPETYFPKITYKFYYFGEEALLDLPDQVEDEDFLFRR